MSFSDYPPEQRAELNEALAKNLEDIAKKVRTGAIEITNQSIERSIGRTFSNNDTLVEVFPTGVYVLKIDYINKAEKEVSDIKLGIKSTG